MTTRKEFLETFDNVIPAEMLRQRRDNVVSAIARVCDQRKGAIEQSDDSTVYEQIVAGIEKLHPDLLPIPRNEVVVAVCEIPEMAIVYGAERGIDLGRGIVGLFRKSAETS